MTSRLDLYRQYLEEVWSNGRTDRLAHFVTATSKSDGLIADVSMTRDDIEELVPALHAHLDCIQHQILHSYEEGDLLHVMMRVKAISKASGSVVEFSGQSLVGFQGNQISSMHDHYDLIGLFSQLGFLPHDVVALCLSGERIS